MRTTALAPRERRALKRAFQVAALLLLPLTVGAAADSEVVAKIGQTEVTLADVQTLFSSLDPAVRQQVASNHQALEQLVRNYATQAVLYSEAQAKNWDKRADVQARIAQAVRDAVVRSYLGAVATPPDDYPSDADIQAVYDQNQGRFTTPRTFHLAQIYVQAPANADKAAMEATRRKAIDIVTKARAKVADFAALAKANDPENKDGGDLGFLGEDDLQPESRKVVVRMKKGDVSDPISSPTGFHILHLIDTKPAAVRPLSEVSTQIRAFLRQRRQEELTQQYVANLLKVNPISINEIALDKAAESQK